MAKKKKKKKGKDKEEKNLGYYDGIIFSGLSPEELDKEYERLKEESDKLTDWPEM
ncbi:hypothetical protein [Faecalicoccus pleomorphus]|uniref:hypothetical protein n=1 Tax=Faecalicoccus pleomorphus TaxID=1323 RepID=UPI0024317AEF|nr:hypothetical protein [Faecalicoccus pleomorphus]